MNAKTVLNDRTKLKLLQRLEALHHSAQDLIFRDTRSEGEVDALLDAMQAFKQGQLRGVVRPVMDGSTQEDVLKAFSMTVEETPFSDECKKYLLRRGVRYIGEIYYVIFDARSPASVQSGKTIFRELRGIYGLKPRLDPLTMGWVPPYWNEPFRIYLNLPVLKVFGEYDSVAAGDSAFRYGILHSNPANKGVARRLHGLGIHFVGQYILRGREPKSPRRGSAWMPGQLEDKQKVLTAVHALVWAAALIPPNWRLAHGVPQCWLDEQKKIEQETVEWQAQMERERQERGVVEPPRLTDEEELEANLLRNIEELELSVRSASVLEAMGIRFVGQLIGYTEGELLKMRSGDRYIGRKSLKEIKEILGVMGFSLGMVLPPEIKAKLDALVAASRKGDRSAQ